MNGYELSRCFWDYAFEHPEKIRPIHSAIFFFAIEHCNRLGWKTKFGFPTTMAMDAIGVKSYNTYTKALQELVDYGFVKMIQRSKNQYSANIIALSKNDKALDKALDKAFIKHDTKQSESTVQSTVSINKPLTNKPLTNYSEREFLKDWNELRKEHLNKPSFLNSIGKPDDKENFHDLIKDYSREDIRNALIGLFKQKKLPNGNTTMQSNPSHFFKYFNSYLTAYHDRNTSLYGKEKQETL